MPPSSFSISTTIPTRPLPRPVPIDLTQPYTSQDYLHHETTTQTILITSSPITSKTTPPLPPTATPTATLIQTSTSLLHAPRSQVAPTLLQTVADLLAEDPFSPLPPTTYPTRATRITDNDASNAASNEDPSILLYGIFHIPPSGKAAHPRITYRGSNNVVSTQSLYVVLHLHLTLTTTPTSTTITAATVPPTSPFHYAPAAPPSLRQHHSNAIKTYNPPLPPYATPHTPPPLTFTVTLEDAPFESCIVTTHASMPRGDEYGRESKETRARPGKSAIARPKSPSSTTAGKQNDVPLPPNSTAPVIHYITALSRTLHELYSSPVTYDAAVHAYITSTLLPASLPPLSPPEEALVGNCLSDDDQTHVVTRGCWTLTSSSVLSPVRLYVGPMPHDKSEPWKKIVSVVDRKGEDVVAYLVNHDGERRVREHVEGGGGMRRVYGSEGRSVFVATVCSMPVGVVDRCIVTWYCWGRVYDEVEKQWDYVVAFRPIEEYGDCESVREVMADCRTRAPNEFRRGRVERRGYYKISRVAANVCTLTIVSRTTYGTDNAHDRVSQRMNHAFFPDWLKRARFAREAKVIGDYQHDCMRNGAVVDKEIRDDFIAAIPSLPDVALLDDEQKEIVDECTKLETNTVTREWFDLKAPSPFTQMQMVYPYFDETDDSSHRFPRSLGRATCVVDTSAMDVLAWYDAFGSRENMRLAKESNDPVKLVISSQTRFDKQTVQVKHMIFPFSDREFKNRTVLFTKGEHPNLTLVAATCPVKEDIWNIPLNYARDSLKYPVVKASVKGTFCVYPINDNMCKVVMHAVMDAGGSIPLWLVRAKVPESMLWMDKMRETFQRNAEIDETMLTQLQGKLAGADMPYDDDEKKMLDSALDMLDDIHALPFNTLDTPDHFVKIGLSWIDKDPMAVGKAITVVDATIEECAAWEMEKTGRANTQEYYNFGGLRRDCVDVNEHHWLYHVVYDFAVPGLSPREFVCRVLWSWGGGRGTALDRDKLLCVYQTIDHPQFPETSAFVRATALSFFFYEKMPPIGNVPQTRVAYIQQVDLMGNIPKFYLNGLGVQNMMYISRMRRFHDKSHSLEVENHKEMLKRLKEHSSGGTVMYEKDELGVLKKGRECFVIFEKDDHDENVKKTKLQGGGVLVHDEIAYKDGDAFGWGRSETLVRASPEQILAYMWTMDDKHRWSDSDIERRILETKNDHHHISYQCKKRLRDGLVTSLARESVSDFVWARETDDSILYVGMPTEHPDARASENSSFESTQGFLRSHHKKNDREREVSVREAPAGIRVKSAGGSTRAQTPKSKLGRGMAASMRESLGGSTGYGRGQIRVRSKWTCAMRIRSINPTTCRVIYVSHLDLGRSIAAFAMTKHLRLSLAITLRARNHFENIRELDQYEEPDGKMLALRLFYGSGAEESAANKKTKKKRCDLVKEIVDSHRGLKTMLKEYPWLTIFLEEAVKGQLAISRAVKSNLVSIGDLEAKRLGASLSPALRQRKTPEAGVYQWRMQNPCISELYEKYPWTEHLVLTMAQEILKTAPWGVVWRVVIGATLSFLDLGSDLGVIVYYFQSEEQRAFGWGLLAFVLMNLALQLGISFVQHWEYPTVLLQEAVVVVFGLKPALDAFRVATSQEQQRELVLDPKTELVFCKCAEVFTESIPGAILQIYAFTVAPEFKKRAVFSIFISALTTGFSGATVSYDLDTDPSKRRHNPFFYGYVPDPPNERMGLFLCMIFNGAVMLLIRGLCVCMLISVNTTYFFWYLGCDYGSYLLLKIARHDFHYHLNIPGALGIVASVIARVAAKGISDYTGLLHMRASQELGGVYWTFSMVVSFGMAFLSLWLYSHHEQGVMVFYMQVAVPVLVGIWIALFATMVRLMKRDYRKSFFSFETGAEQTRALFLETRDDAKKSKIFKKNPRQWKSIRGEVKDWLNKMWFIFEDTKPDWFTDAWMGLVDEDLLPSANLRRRGSLGEPQRRSSIKGLINLLSVDGGNAGGGGVDTDQVDRVAMNRISLRKAHSVRSVVPVVE